MMTKLLILSAGFVVWLFFDLKKRASIDNVILSPMFYFTGLWFLAFPLHAWLLYQGWVDTQQNVVLTEGALTAAVLLSIVSLLVVYFGMRTGRSFQPEQAFKSKSFSVKPERVSAVLMVLMVLAVFFLSQTVFEQGTFTPFIGNDQNESRLGNGPLFMLSELFIYGLIVAIPALLTSGQQKAQWWLLLLIFVAGLVFALFMGIALTSRRVIVLPLFALALARLYTYSKHPNVRAVLGATLLASTVLVTPALQVVRYIATPQAPIERSIDERSIADYCRWVGRTPTPQKTVIILDAKGAERTISGMSASIAKKFCDESNYGFLMPVQNIASSYGLVDHLATFLNKAAPSEMIFGVDHGIAWSYNMVLSMVPRVIWAEKPLHYGSVAIQKWMYPEMYEDKPVTMTLPPSFVVDFLYGFGFLSLLIVCFGLGRFLALVHVWLLSGLQPGNHIRFVVGLSSMAYMFNLVRGGTGFFQVLIPIVIIMFLMYGAVGFRELFSRSKV
ncbi:hypothetical protein [Azospira sp. I09]|uniref:hypothetical protein n=1 Tax=Azospira sp. I09 TaxID=1765049 RepID=UPI001260A939|nr:hypothetical protein [Azospira sp. I09]